MFGLSFPRPIRLLNQFKLWRWRQKLGITSHLKVMAQISADINGFTLSKQARRQQDAFEYVYGEIDWATFIALLSLCHPNEETVFYDLGSGTGKAVFACAMVFPVKKSCGVELFQPLFQAAETARYRLADIPTYQKIANTIHFIQGNFLEVDIDDATLIFINATGYFGDTWDKLNHRLEKLTACETVLTTSKPLSSQRFTVEHVTTVRMSFGIVNAYIHRKTAGQTT